MHVEITAKEADNALMDEIQIALGWLKANFWIISVSIAISSFLSIFYYIKNENIPVSLASSQVFEKAPLVFFYNSLLAILIVWLMIYPVIAVVVDGAAHENTKIRSKTKIVNDIKTVIWCVSATTFPAFIMMILYHILFNIKTCQAFGNGYIYIIPGNEENYAAWMLIPIIGWHIFCSFKISKKNIKDFLQSIYFMVGVTGGLIQTLAMTMIVSKSVNEMISFFGDFPYIGQYLDNFYGWIFIVLTVSFLFGVAQYAIAKGIGFCIRGEGKLKKSIQFSLLMAFFVNIHPLTSYALAKNSLAIYSVNNKECSRLTIAKKSAFNPDGNNININMYIRFHADGYYYMKSNLKNKEVIILPTSDVIKTDSCTT